MANLILVSNRKINRPYYVRDLDIHLYSPEELSYYIYNYQFFLTEEFVDERLLEFIGTELEMPVLEKKLRRWKGQADFFQMMAMILQECHYYDDQEINEFLRQADTIRHSDPVQLMKQRGDFLLSRHKYYGALEHYDRILAGDWRKPLSSDFQGKVWFNKGGALAGMFAFSQAMDAFVAAYRMMGTDEALRKIYEVHLLDPLCEIPKEIRKEMSRSNGAKWRKDFASVRELVVMEGKYARAKGVFESDDENKPQKLWEMFDEWKSEYRQMI